MAQDPEDDPAMRARLDALKGQLDRRAAERREQAAETARQAAGGGFGGPAVTQAFQAGAEFVAAIVLGGAIGYGLDRWLGTKPWFLIVFFLLGSVVGVRSVIRVASPKGRDEVRNSPLSGGQAPDKDEPRPASKAAPQAPTGQDEDED